MIKFILNDNYRISVDNYCAKPKIRKFLNGHYKLTKRKDRKLVFTNNKFSFTLFTTERSYYERNAYCCNITLQKNNDYRITKYGLTPNSIFLIIKIYPIKLHYLESYICISILDRFLFLVDFYNKTNVKKSLKRVPAIKKVFQDNYILVNLI